MSERGLVVRQGSLTEIESAMTRATDEIREHLTGLLDTVDRQMTAWTEETPSRVAQRAHEQRLRDGVDALVGALDSIRVAVAAQRGLARDTEVENVAIVG